MSDPLNRPDAPVPLRLFLYEPEWQIGLKSGTEREFCHQMAPGQDYYHRLLEHEVILYKQDERICFACAVRRGLLSCEPRLLRQPVRTLNREPGRASDFELPVRE